MAKVIRDGDGLLYFVLWLVQNTRDFSLNQSHWSKTKANHDFGSHFSQFACFYFESYWLWKVFLLSSDWPSGITLVLGLKHSIQKHSICVRYFSCRFYYTVIPPSWKWMICNNFFIAEQQQPETEAGKRHHIDLHVSSVLFHGTWNSVSLQQSHTSYQAI